MQPGTPLAHGDPAPAASAFTRVRAQRPDAGIERGRDCQGAEHKRGLCPGLTPCFRPAGVTPGAFSWASCSYLTGRRHSSSRSARVAHCAQARSQYSAQPVSATDQYMTRFHALLVRDGRGSGGASALCCCILAGWLRLPEKERRGNRASRFPLPGERASGWLMRSASRPSRHRPPPAGEPRHTI